MGLSLGKTIALSVCATGFLLCSCDKHQLGEYPEVQRDLAEVNKNPPSAETPPPSSATPPAKPTPVEFFPTKPR
jgi:hypothetical protein